MSPRRLARNGTAADPRFKGAARLVRCSAGCGLLVWLAGALPVAGDATFVCETCTKAAEAEALARAEAMS